MYQSCGFRGSRLRITRGKESSKIIACDLWTQVLCCVNVNAVIYVRVCDYDVWVWFTLFIVGVFKWLEEHRYTFNAFPLHSSWVWCDAENKWRSPHSFTCCCSCYSSDSLNVRSGLKWAFKSPAHSCSAISWGHLWEHIRGGCWPTEHADLQYAKLFLNSDPLLYGVAIPSDRM